MILNTIKAIYITTIYLLLSFFNNVQAEIQSVSTSHIGYSPTTLEIFYTDTEVIQAGTEITITLQNFGEDTLLPSQPIVRSGIGFQPGISFGIQTSYIRDSPTTSRVLFTIDTTIEGGEPAGAKSILIDGFITAYNPNCYVTVSRILADTTISSSSSPQDGSCTIPTDQVISTSSLSITTPGAASVLTTSFKFNVLPIVNDSNIGIDFSNFDAIVAANPTITLVSGWSGGSEISNVVYDNVSKQLTGTISTTIPIPANTFVTIQLPIINPASPADYNVGLIYDEAIFPESNPLTIVDNPEFIATGSLSNNIPGASSDLTTSLRVNTITTIGSTIGIDFIGHDTGFSSSISTTSPSITLISDLGATEFSDVTYDAVRQRLTWTVINADIPANTLITFEVPIVNPTTEGIFDWGVIYAEGILPISTPLVITSGAVVSNVSAVVTGSPVEEEELSDLWVSFKYSGSLAAGNTVQVYLPGFGGSISPSPIILTEVGATISSATYNANNEVLTVTFGSPTIAANTPVTLIIPTLQHPAAGSYYIEVRAGCCFVKAVQPLVIYPILGFPDKQCSNPVTINPTIEASNNAILSLEFYHDAPTIADTITFNLLGFGTGISANPVVTGDISYSTANYNSVSGDLVLSGVSFPPESYLDPVPTQVSIPITQNPAAGLYDLEVSYNGRLASAPLIINPAFNATSALDVITPDDPSILTVSFSIDALMTTGSTIGIDLKCFGADVATNPGINLTSGWGISGFSDAIYDSVSEQLTWTVTNADVPANTLVEVEVPLAANPASGTYNNVGVIYAGGILPVSNSLTLLNTISSVSSSLNNSLASANNTTLSVSFSIDGPILPGNFFKINLPGFGTSITSKPVISQVSGWGTTTLTSPVWDSSTGVLTVSVSGSGFVAANTLVTVSVPIIQNPELGNYTVGVEYMGAQGSSPLVIDNNPPSFVNSGPGGLTVAQNSPAVDIKDLLYISDIDATQTETWSQSSAPSHGILSFDSATASSGSTVIESGGSITYTPTLGYVGTDSFTIQVSDGINSTTRVIDVIVANIISSISSSIPGEASTLTVSFLSASPLPIGTTVTVSMPGFGNAIVSFPAISLVSGWGPTGFNSVSYSAASSTLTWSTTNFPVPAGTLLTVNIPVVQNPVAGNYNVAVMESISASLIPSATDLVFNTPPVFVNPSNGNLNVAQNDTAIDIKNLLHVSDIDSSQSLSWSEAVSPSHGTLNISSATNTSGSIDITPGGSITYTPTPDFVGTDSFAIQINDALASAVRVINVDIVDSTAPTISTVTIVPSLTMTVGSEVTATIIVISDIDDYTSGLGGISGTIAGFSLANLSRLNATTYTASFIIIDGGTDVAADSDIPVNLTLSDSSGNISDAYTSAINQGNDAIYANLPDVTLIASPNSIDEDAGSSILTATLSGSLANQWPADITINLAFSGTATLFADFSSSNSITVSSGNSSGTTEIILLPDDTSEEDETIIVDIISISGGANQSGIQQQTVTIIDNDNIAPVIGGTSAGQAVNDNANILPFTTVTISDFETDNVITTVTLDDNTKGSFTEASLLVSGFTGLGPYTLASTTPSMAQAAIRLLMFDPTENTVAVDSTETTTFTIDVNDEANTANNTTTVVSTSINDIPTITLLPTDVSATEDTLSDVDISALILADNDIVDTDYTFILAVDSGLLSATSTGTVIANGSGTATLTLTGPMADIDSFLDITNSIQYTGAIGINGDNAATLTVTLNDEDGSGQVSGGSTNLDIDELIDVIPPVITLIGDNPQSFEVGSSYVELGATAIDNKDGDITEIIIIDASAVNMNVVDSYSVTYDVQDAAGNDAIQITRTVNVEIHEADLGIIKTDAQTSYTIGEPITYMITVTNDGPTDVVDALIQDTLSAPLDSSSAVWDCTANLGASCTSTGVGSIHDLANIPSGASVNYALTVLTADPEFEGSVINTATVTEPVNITDSNQTNNISTDSSLSVLFTNGFEDPLLALQKWLSIIFDK